mmetsp:Transcript_21043/g.27216  ORF Transcript_21043/g.27216 Transcript_21043/m.27216 type:complete len:407 (+) Transcript_21043:31-1251(+)
MEDTAEEEKRIDFLDFINNFLIQNDLDRRDSEGDNVANGSLELYQIAAALELKRNLSSSLSKKLLEKLKRLILKGTKNLHDKILEYYSQLKENSPTKCKVTTDLYFSEICALLFEKKWRSYFAAKSFQGESNYQSYSRLMIQVVELSTIVLLSNLHTMRIPSRDGRCIFTEKLIQAVCVKNVEWVKIFLKAGAAVDGYYNDEEKLSPLHKAVLLDNSLQKQEIIHLLLQAGANPNIKNEFGEGPLHVSIKQKNLSKQVLDLLLNYGGNINAYSTIGVTPLHIACWSRFDDGIQLLLNSGANPNLATSMLLDRWMPIHYVSCFGCSLKSFMLLIKSGADTGVTNNDGLTPLQIASKTKNSSVVLVLKDISLNKLKYGAPPKHHVGHLMTSDMPNWVSINVIQHFVRK